MDTKKSKTSFFILIKNWIACLVRNFWRLNWDAKIGIILLIPPLLGVLVFVLNMFGAEIDYYYRGYDSDKRPASSIPIYLGLLAIAGAYLIKGNLRRKE